MPGKVKAEARLMVDVMRARTARRATDSAVHTTFVNSLPKAGTHLLVKVMRALPGLYGVRFHLGRDQAKVYQPKRGESRIPAGIASPEDMSLPRLARAIRHLGAGVYFTGHMPYSAAFRDLLADCGVKTVLILRDPRDVVVSSAAYLAARPNHHLSGRFTTLDEEERILASITGLPSDNGRAGLRSIGERMRSVLPWTTDPSVYVTRFERLVGPRGGGSVQAQVCEIRNIAAHVGVSLGEAQVHDLAAGLFGGTGTFRKGQIGGWRQVWTARHVEAAKPQLDDLLIQLGYESTADWGLGKAVGEPPSAGGDREDR